MLSIKRDHAERVRWSFCDWAITVSSHFPWASAPRFVFSHVIPIGLEGHFCTRLAQVLCVEAAQEFSHMLGLAPAAPQKF